MASRSFHAFAFGLLAAGAVAGCTITPNGATDAGPVDAAATGTIGGQCTRIWTVLCQRDISTCGAAFDLNTCVMNGLAQCCADKCSKPAITTDTAIQGCADAVTAEDCNLIVNNALPGACVGIPATQ